MAYAKLFSTITESSLWSASKDARLLFMSMLAKADAVGFVEAALPGLARLANLTMPETEGALTELMAPDPYSKSTDCGGARVVKVERGWCLVNYEAYRDRRDEDAKREYMRNYMRDYRAKNGPVPAQNPTPVNFCKAPLNIVGEAEAEAAPEAEAKGERESPPAPLVLQDEKGDGLEAFLLSFDCKTVDRKGVSLMGEWRIHTKGLKPKQVREILEAAKPGIEWPSEFKAHRAAKGTY